MNIIGFNCYGHDASAAIISNNKLIFAIEEERLTRKKHTGEFPLRSIEECLHYAKLSIQDIQHFTYFWNPWISYAHIPEYFIKYWHKVPGLILEQRNLSVEENLGLVNYLPNMFALPSTIKKYFGNSSFKFHRFEHHACHAASAFFVSPFERASILTIDGAGEWATCSMSIGEGNKITRIKNINTPYSLGAFYQAISVYLGFKYIEGPGKLMGLASYGDSNSKEYDKLKKLIRLNSDGTFSIDMSYFSYHYSRKNGVSQKFIKEFGNPVTKDIRFDKHTDWSEKSLNIAAAAQRVVEETILHMATYIQKHTKTEYLCLAGGVALNSVSNGKLMQSGIFKDIYIQPAAGDQGTSLGSALWLNHQILKSPRSQHLNTAFLGQEYTDLDYLKSINEHNLSFQKFEDEDLYDFIAKKIYDNNIVAWFQGRMEFGPRALGNRSILANPINPDMKNILNQRVKFRETFRPFAAIVNIEDCGAYFSYSKPNPFMLLVYEVKETYRNQLPSITHFDGTVRIQTIDESENKPMRRLLDSFKKISGFSVLINTSYNIKGEPIVSSPSEAVKSYMASDIDYLVMGNYVVFKK